ncbi:MAG: DNA double-strand break repair nuclease NurA [Acidilobaceae archaeon]
MPVVEGLLDKVLGVREHIEKALAKMRSIKVEGLEWIPLELQEAKDLLFVASDSSRQHENFRGLFIYAVQGVAVAYSTAEGVLKREVDSDARVIELVGKKVRRFVEAILDNSSKRLEVKLVEKIIENNVSPSYVLFDGSYESFAQAILVPFRRSFREEIYAMWKERVESLARILKSFQTVFISKSIKRTYLNKECGITVRLGDNEIEVPDIIIIGKVINEAKVKTSGILWPAKPYIELRNAPLWRGKAELEALDNLSEKYTMFYALLSPWGRVYRITVPKEISLQEAEEIVRDLSVVSVNDGYPHPLAVVHHLSKLTRKDFKDMLALVAWDLESGREPLNYTIS